jgi:hypothetical protein
MSRSSKLYENPPKLEPDDSGKIRVVKKEKQTKDEAEEHGPEGLKEMKELWDDFKEKMDSFLSEEEGE